MFGFKAGKEYEDANATLFETNKILWKMILIETFVILALVFGYLNLKETVSVRLDMPSKIYQSKDLTIRRGLNWADASYYEVWGRAMAEEISDFSVDNIGEKFAILQKTMRPSQALKKDKEIQDFTRSAIQNRISQDFTVMHVAEPSEIEKGKFRVVFNGVAAQKVGTKEMPRKECSYSIDLKIYEDGVLYVEDFGTNCMQ